MQIRLAEQKDMRAFFSYLSRQLAENGVGGAAIFQPMSRKESYLSDAMKSRFTHGIATEMGEQGWRKMLLAFIDGNIVGHIDIRAHAEGHTAHRALLGMGVDATARGKGLGNVLIESIFNWTAAHTDIEYIDLWVLSNNQVACRLYERSGFTKCGEVADMFRIDGTPQSYSMMSKAVMPANLLASADREER
ncbi:GNAT family N-acetyltransferase [Shewanella kaireitica]|uniref:GNAT family N-acetyltransferase n=1 Tax=Shewanella kaireitica TaxID=212021 RepID=UPI00200D0FAC|nr:GNAT family N-acetyltransferase [Shewanella kaireitica]MCL1093254.1 GNAT family N-acetyltransferase [Shewanella kaireitica]